VTDIAIGEFLAAPQHPEHEALLRLIGTLVSEAQGADPGNPTQGNIGGEWSDTELSELGNMLVRGLSILEIARCLRRSHGNVQDKVVEVGRACR
jgi:hypothetical protein